MPVVMYLFLRGVSVFVLSILLLIAAVVLFVVGHSQDAGGWKIGAALSAVAAVLSGVFACVHVVSAYEVGVPVTFGKIGKPLNSGIQFKSPFTDVTSFSTRPVDLNFYGKDVVEVRSSQGGVLYAEFTIKWAVVPAKAVELYRLAGSEEAVEERLVVPDSREIIRNVFAKHTSEEGYASAREQIGSEVAALVKERLAPRGIDITIVNLRNVKPSDQLQDQIDKKIQQEQATERSIEAARTAKAEAERKRIEAEAEAERTRIAAKAEAERTEISAKATARANETLAKSLSDKILFNQCLNAYKEAAKSNPVYAVPCGTDANGTPVIVDSTKD